MKSVKGIESIGKGSLVALGVALTFALAAAPAWSATIVVPTQESSIQDGIDAAGVGDTVVVKKNCGTPGVGVCGNNGVYHEQPDITAKITLLCRGAVIDGAVPSDIAGAGGPTVLVGDGIDIESGADGTVVKGCTVQNFDSNGIDVNDADEVTIQNNTLVNNSEDGLELDGDDFTVKNNSAINNSGNGFDFPSTVEDGLIQGNIAISNDSRGFDMPNGSNKRNKFLRNRALRNGTDGFHIHGDDHTIIGNRAETNDDQGFDLGSPIKTSLVERNLARGNDEEGFNCDGNCDELTVQRNVALENGLDGFDFCCDADDNKIIKNLAIGNGETGFDIQGDDNEVAGNRAIQNQADGFKINCDNDDGGGCGGPITDNRSIRNVAGDGFNFEDLLMTTVSGNKAIANEEDGFDCDVNCDDTLFENNLARGNADSGFEQSCNGSDDNTYQNNRSIRNSDAGFQINCSPSDTKLINNVVKRNDGDGIDIELDSDSTVIDGNRVINNRGTGIENDGGADTSIKNNTMRGNHTDLAGKGDDETAGVCDNDAATNDGGNTFTSGDFDVCTPGTGDE